MTMIASDAAAVTTEAEGAARHAALLAEARVALGAVLACPLTTPEEVAVLLDSVTGGSMDEVTLSVVTDALVG